MIEQRDKKVLIDIFFHKNKTAYLNQVMEAIPFVQKLDSSFWENRSFLRWQLMRLNKVYQEDVCKVWKKYMRYRDPQRGSAIVDRFCSFGELPRTRRHHLWIGERHKTYLGSLPMSKE